MFCGYISGPPDSSCSRQSMAPGSILGSVFIAIGYMTEQTSGVVAMQKSLLPYVYLLSVLIPRLLKAFGVLIPNVHTLLSKRTLNSRHHCLKKQNQNQETLKIFHIQFQHPLSYSQLKTQRRSTGTTLRDGMGRGLGGVQDGGHMYTHG